VASYIVATNSDRKIVYISVVSNVLKHALVTCLTNISRLPPASHGDGVYVLCTKLTFNTVLMKTIDCGKSPIVVNGMIKSGTS
jgi:hypothetical protein